MNLSQLNKLKHGDKVVFEVPFYPFTVGEEYIIENPDDFGCWVTDDNGVGRRLFDICSQFSSVNKEV